MKNLYYLFILVRITIVVTVKDNGKVINNYV